MADSANTKWALAQALKSLMERKSFTKISVVDICQACGMNRKSFYYHFRDKYDLMNWIFDTEFCEISRTKTYETEEQFFLDLCCYFYENRDFYRKALVISGQNCLTDHFRQAMADVLQLVMHQVMPEVDFSSFQLGFYTDSIVCAYYRWITGRTCMPPEQFIGELKQCIHYMAEHYQKK